MNPRASFIPYNSHSLNIAVNDVVMLLRDNVSFFGVVQKIYVFLSVSSHHWSVLKEHVNHIMVKSLNDTR
jgi:hypothetical protein